MSRVPDPVFERMNENRRAGRPVWEGIGDGPCAIGGMHTRPALNGMVYCEHGITAYHCDRCMGRPDTYDPICESCGVPKEKHTEVEAMYCITRQIAEASDRGVYVAGLSGSTKQGG